MYMAICITNQPTKYVNEWTKKNSRFFPFLSSRLYCSKHRVQIISINGIQIPVVHNTSQNFLLCVYTRNVGACESLEESGNWQ